MINKRRIQNSHLKKIRNNNTLKVLKTMMKHEPISRIDLSKATGLSPTTVTHIVDKLKESGWLYEGNEGVSNGGRKPILLNVNRNNRFVICLQVTQKSVKGVIYDLEPTEVYRVEKNIPCLGKAILDIIIETVEEMLNHMKEKELDVLAAGIGIPGIINAKTGVLVYATDLELENIHLKEIIEERFGITVYIQNDANLAALAEKTYGIAKNENMMVYIKELGGAGIVIDGEIYLGHNGGAGEIGHISIDRNGERCKCGNYGCLYQYVSKMAIESNAIKAIKQGVETKLFEKAGFDFNRITIEAIIHEANSGDTLCRQLVMEAATNVGVAIVSLVNILDIRFIVIGGAFAKAGDYFYKQVMNTFRSRTSKLYFKNIRLEKSRLDEDIGLLGCVCMILNETFKMPIN